MKLRLEHQPLKQLVDLQGEIHCGTTTRKKKCWHVSLTQACSFTLLGAFNDLSMLRVFTANNILLLLVGIHSLLVT